jgi:sulfate transport system permease protein
MSGSAKSNLARTRDAARRGAEEPPLVKWTLIILGLGFALVFLLLPLVSVFTLALTRGFSYFISSLATPDSISAIKLTLVMSALSVPANMIFGIAAAWAIAKFDFKGKAFLITLIDLPFAISPVVAGLIFVLLFGLQGYLGRWLDDHDIRIIFAVPGMAIVTTFVTFPFIARELIPVLQSTGSEQEQAALTLGASGWQTFWHVTLPSMKWGLLYGIILCNARAMGEFGAVYVVSAHIMGLTETMPLRVQSLYEDPKGETAAFGIAALLAMLALVTLCLKTLIEWRVHRKYALAQMAPVELNSPPSS